MRSRRRNALARRADVTSGQGGVASFLGLLNPANGPTEKWRLRTSPLLAFIIATELFPIMLVAVAEVCVAGEFLTPLW
jgi:hypothetical protein